MSKQRKIAQHYQSILELLGYNLTDENLRDTPNRLARYLIEFLVDWDDGNIETVFPSISVDQLVIVKDIPFWSLCSHHMLPFKGTISVGYLTGTQVLGLSKIPRIVQKHAHKLQLQEQLAHDIANGIEEILDDNLGVAVLIKAEHSCMQMRGIRSDGTMITSVMTKSFRDDPNLKMEFLSMVTYESPIR